MVNDLRPEHYFLEKEASYKVEPYINNEISINLNSYDGDFELHDISDLIDRFKEELNDGDSKARGEDND